MTPNGWCCEEASKSQCQRHSSACHGNQNMLIANRDNTASSSVQTQQLCRVAQQGILKRHLGEEGKEAKEALLSWYEMNLPGGLMLEEDKARIGDMAKDRKVFEQRLMKAKEIVEEKKLNRTEVQAAAVAMFSDTTPLRYGDAGSASIATTAETGVTQVKATNTDV